MCLITPGPLNKATEDIVCYKILCECYHIGGETTLHSPYFRGYESWKVGEMTTPVSMADYNGTKYARVGAGFLHSFKSVKDAFDLANIKLFLSRDVACVYKCVIPKGTQYYQGFDDCNCFGYASKALKPIEKLSSIR